MHHGGRLGQDDSVHVLSCACSGGVGSAAKRCASPTELFDTAATATIVRTPKCGKLKHTRVCSDLQSACRARRLQRPHVVSSKISGLREDACCRLRDWVLKRATYRKSEHEPTARSTGRCCLQRPPRGGGPYIENHPCATKKRVCLSATCQHSAQTITSGKTVARAALSVFLPSRQTGVGRGLPRPPLPANHVVDTLLEQSAHNASAGFHTLQKINRARVDSLCCSKLLRSG